MSGGRLEPFFIDGAAGRIFALLRAPREACGLVIVVPPFAEEMNKSRRQITLTAERLVERGLAVLVVDLFGTGDSEGDFAEASWQTWVEDVLACFEWARRNDFALHGLIALRLGAVLAAEAARRAGTTVARTAFWQPVGQGQQFMNQFIRLRVAASMMEAGGGETNADLVQRLEHGETLEIAGYELSPSLWGHVRGLKLGESISGHLGEIAVFDIGRRDDGAVSPRTTKLVAGVTEQGGRATAIAVAGDPFWSSTEIVTNAELTSSTASFLCGAPG